MAKTAESEWGTSIILSLRQRGNPKQKEGARNLSKRGLGGVLIGPTEWGGMTGPNPESLAATSSIQRREREGRN